MCDAVGGTGGGPWVPQVTEQTEQPGPAAGAAALHRALGTPRTCRGLLDRVALHVDEHQRRPLLGRQRCERRLTSSDSPCAGVGHAGPRRGRSSVASSGSGTVGRAARRRSRSRQALTTIRCSQVVTADVAAERPARPEGREQRVLQRVGRLLAVAEGAQRHGPQPVPVPADQLGERVGIAVRMS